jgi:hypothetical protein
VTSSDFNFCEVTLRSPGLAPARPSFQTSTYLGDNSGTVVRNLSVVCKLEADVRLKNYCSTKRRERVEMFQSTLEGVEGRVSRSKHAPMAVLFARPRVLARVYESRGGLT